MRRFLLFLLVVAALLFVVLPYFVLPAVLENLVARDVQSRLDLARAPDVDLDSDPQWEMLRGEFSGGRIAADDFDIGGVRTENAAIIVDRPFAVDLPASFSNRVVVPKTPLSGRLRIEISEEEVARLVRLNAGVPINDLTLRREGVTVESETTALGTTIPVSVTGRVGVDAGSLYFAPGAVEAAGIEVPDFVAQGLLAGMGFSYPVSNLPYGSSVTGARTTDGSVIVTGRVPNVDLGAVSGG